MNVALAITEALLEQQRSDLRRLHQIEREMLHRLKRARVEYARGNLIPLPKYADLL